MLEKIGKDQDGTRFHDIYVNNAKPLKALSKCKREELVKELFSVSQETSVSITNDPIFGDPNHYVCRINKGVSIGKIVGFIEAVPVIGSAIAAISLCGHLLGIAADTYLLKKNTKKLNDLKDEKKHGEKMKEVDVPATYQLHIKSAEKVFNARVSYAQHCRRARASALSLVPLLKPLVRIGQIMHAKSTQPI